MKQMMKRLAGLFLAACVLTTAVLAADIPAAPTDHAVLDQAGVLSQETIDQVDEYNAALASTGAQIGVLTVDFTGNLSIDDYAYQVFNAWGIGDEDENNGVLFLLVIGDENYYCTLGTGLEGEITYSRVKSLLDEYAEPGFAAGDYDDCVTQFTGAMYSELCDLYGVQPGEGEPQAQPPQPHRSSGMGGTFLLLLVILGVLLLVIILGGKGGGGNGGNGGSGGGGRRRDVVFWPVFLGGYGRRRYHRPPPPPFGGPHHGPGGPFGPGPGGFGGGFGGGGFGGGGFGGGGGGFGGFGGGGSRGGGAGRG